MYVRCLRRFVSFSCLVIIKGIYTFSNNFLCSVNCMLYCYYYYFFFFCLLMLLYIMLAYLMLSTALSNVVCLNNAFFLLIFTNAFCFLALPWFIDT